MTAAKLLVSQAALHSGSVTEARRACVPYQSTPAGFGFSGVISMVIYKNHLHVRRRGNDWMSICAWVFTLPPAHIRCHHSSNQQPRGHDWIINQPINASLHSVRLSTSKYLPMQNNPWRLDHHFKLSLCTAHNQDGLGGAVERGGKGKKSSAPSPNFHADSQTSYAFGCRWGARKECVWSATKHHSLVDLVCKPLSH